MPRIRYKELVGSEEFQGNASAYAKGAIFVSTLTLIGCFFAFSKASMVAYFVIFVVWALFGTSIFIAMPAYLTFCLVASLMSGHTNYPSGAPSDLFGRCLKTLSSLILVLGFIGSAVSTFYMVSYFG